MEYSSLLMIHYVLLDIHQSSALWISSDIRPPGNHYAHERTPGRKCQLFIDKKSPDFACQYDLYKAANLAESAHT